MRSVLWIGPGAGFATRLADSPELDVVWERHSRAAARLPLEHFDAVVLDAEDAEAALSELRALGAGPLPPVLVRLLRGAASSTVRHHAAASVEVLDGSGEAAESALLERLRALGPRRPAPAGRRAPSPGAHLIGSGPEMERVFALIRVAAGSRATVLLTGETGTGKELVAREVHRSGPRAPQPFVAINCAAFPDTLLESELFGHARGSFTGAERERRGLFEAANGGTLFLDEIGETSAALQVKLLRALQEREIRPVGSSRTRSVDARVVAATHRELLREAEAGRFREDLYYRLAVFPIHLPPLRRRPADVATLARHFLERYGREEAKPGLRLSSPAVRLLQSHRWPGNVRELENEIQRALALAESGQLLGPEHFSERVAGLLEPIEPNLRPGDSLRETLGRVEAWLIRRTLEQTGGVRTETARLLGITREGLYKKMKRYRIE